MKRERRRMSQGTGDSLFDEANSETRQKALVSKGRTKVSQRRTGKPVARIAVIYSLVAAIYSLAFLSNTSFLQVEVANALAFKLPKPPRIVTNLINNGWPSGDIEQTAPVIQDWSLDKKLSDDGDIIYSLIGTVTGHPAIADGDAIYTAPIVAKDLDTALNLLLETETSATKKFILRGQTSEYATLISTEFGTRYSLLPPNIKISNAPLVSRGKGATGASSDGPIAKSLSNKEKLTYLEEQIEVVRLLAEREDRLEQQKRQEVAEIVRDAGVIVAAALTGAAYFVGDNPSMFPETTQTAAIVNTVKEIKNVVKQPQTTAVGTTDGAEASLQAIPEEEVRVAKPAKALLPYLEERIKALEDEQQKAREQENNGKTEPVKDEERDISESKDKSGVAKILTDIKESMTQSDSDTPNGADEEKKPLAKLQGEISKLRTDSEEATKQPESGGDAVSNKENDDTKQTPVLPMPSSVQEGMTKIITDFKESIIQPDSGSDSVANDATNSDQNGGIAGADSLSQSLQAQQAKVVDQIGKIAEGLSVMGQDTSSDIGAVVSDLASAGKQVLGDAATSSDDAVTNAKEDIGGLASSALSIFGSDEVMSIYQYLAGVLQSVYDTFSLNEMWSDVVDLSSKLKEDPRMSQFLKGFNDYDEDEKVRLVAAASFVSVLGVTTAVARSQMYGYMEGTNEYESGMESGGWSEYPPDQYAGGWESYDEGSFDGYNDGDASSPFPFATSSWDDQSTEYNNNGYSQPQGQGWTDTSSSYDESWTQEGGSNDNENPFSGSYDRSTSQVEDVDTPKSGFSPFGNSREDKVEATTVPKAGSTPFDTPSRIPTNEQDNQDQVAPKKGFSPFGKASSTKATTQKKEDNADSSSPKTTSPFGAPPSKTSSTLPASLTKKGETEDTTSSSTPGASPFGGPPPKTTSPFGAPKKSSPFGAPSTKKDETEDATSSTTPGASPFGGPPPKATSPFGAPKKSSPFGAASTKTGATEDSTTTFKTSSLPFGGPPQKTTSPFGAASTKTGATEDSTTTFKTSSSPFGGPPPKATSPFGAPKKSSPFDATSAKTGETEDATSGSTPGASPFGGPPQKTTSPFGAPKKSSPFGAASTKTGATEDATSSTTPGASPFGGPPQKTTSPFGAPKKSSPFGGPPTKSGSPFGGPQKLQSKEESDSEASAPKVGISPFGGPSPTKSSTFGTTSPKSSSPFGSTSPKTTTPFGTPGKFPTSKQANKDGTSYFTDSSSSFGVPPPKKSSPFGGPPRNQSSPFGTPTPKESSPFGATSNQSTANAETEAEIPDIRIRPKIASKPQNDMYERMQEEQAMRLAEYERKNGISSQKDTGTSAKSNGEGAMNFSTTRSSEERNLAAKTAKPEPERRTMAQPRSKRNDEKEISQSQFDGKLNKEDLKEKERMKEIQKLAREQARFEIEARGLSREEKALQEKDRMERLHKLAREQARFEYDRKRSQENRGEPTGGTSKKEKTNVAVGNASSSKPTQKNPENQNRKTLFQTADTPSVEESMQNRVRQEFSNEPTGKRVRPETSDFEVTNVREPARQVRKSAKQEDALMGTKKKTNDRSGAFDTARSVSKEETTTRSEKARREQLENLAEKQAQYKKDRTISSGARNSGKQMNKGQIIDVEAAEDDSGEDKSRTVEESDVNEEPPRGRQGKKVIPENERKTFTEKRKQLEAQARQRAKQQFRRNDKVNVQKKDTANGKRIQPDSIKKTPPKIEETESEDILSLTLPTQPSGESNQQQEIAEAVMRTDGSYQPSAKALSDTSRMLKEVRGFSLSDYKGSKEFINKKSNVSVYVGRTLSVPVRVSTPGSFIEFSITRKASDFDMTILAVPDKGYAFDIKKTAPFTKYAGKTANTLSDTVLIGAPSTPCTLQFKFENKGSTLLDKVIISYSVKVTSPSRKLLLDTRRLRAESCLETIEKDIKGIKVGSTKSLEKEIKKLEAEMKEKDKEIDSLVSEEKRWEALIEKMKKKEASKQKS